MPVVGNNLEKYICAQYEEFEWQVEDFRPGTLTKLTERDVTDVKLYEISSSFS